MTTLDDRIRRHDRHRACNTVISAMWLVLGAIALLVLAFQLGGGDAVAVLITGMVMMLVFAAAHICEVKHRDDVWGDE